MDMVIAMFCEIMWVSSLIMLVVQVSRRQKGIMIYTNRMYYIHICVVQSEVKHSGIHIETNWRNPCGIVIMISLRCALPAIITKGNSYHLSCTIRLHVNSNFFSIYLMLHIAPV